MKDIVFDFGGVLVDWNPRYFYRTVFSDEQEMEYFLANVCNTAWNLRHDTGVRFEDNWQELAKKYSNNPEFIKAMNELKKMAVPKGKGTNAKSSMPDSSKKIQPVGIGKRPGADYSSGSPLDE